MTKQELKIHMEELFKSTKFLTPVCHPVYFCSEECLKSYEGFLEKVFKSKKAED